jgi:hypothetical protein
MNNEISDEDKKAIEAMVSAAVDSAAAVGDRGLRVVAGTDYGQAEAITAAESPKRKRGRREASPAEAEVCIDPPSTEAMTATAKNGRLRERRKKIWRMAEAATRYWRARLDFDHAVSIAQMMEMPEAAYHPVVDSKDHMPMVRRYREALVRHSPPHLMLTRANGSRRRWPGGNIVIPM